MVEVNTNQTCSTTNCSGQATQFCPTCQKLGLPAAPFCSQECFTKSWKAHKAAHKVELPLAFEVKKVTKYDGG